MAKPLYTSKKVLENIEGMNLCHASIKVDDEGKASLVIEIPYGYNEDIARRVMAKMFKDAMSE